MDRSLKFLDFGPSNVFGLEISQCKQNGGHCHDLKIESSWDLTALLVGKRTIITLPCWAVSIVDIRQANQSIIRHIKLFQKT